MLIRNVKILGVLYNYNHVQLQNPRFTKLLMLL